MGLKEKNMAVKEMSGSVPERKRGTSNNASQSCSKSARTTVSHTIFGTATSSRAVGSRALRGSRFFVREGQETPTAGLCVSFVCLFSSFLALLLFPSPNPSWRAARSGETKQEDLLDPYRLNAKEEEEESKCALFSLPFSPVVLCPSPMA